MVRQKFGSKFGEYSQANTEPGSLNDDKKVSVPITAKKAPLRDMQNDNKILMPESVGDSASRKEAGSISEAVKASGIKRPAPECPMIPPQQPCPTSNVVNGHLVYVRRKPEAELGKYNACDNNISDVDYQQSRMFDHQNEIIQQLSQKRECGILTPDIEPIPRASFVSSSSKKFSVSPLAKSNNILPPTDSSFLHIPSTRSSLDGQKKMNFQQWEERLCRLQNLLKQLDQTSLDDYVQMLRSFSSVELSRLAVELEKRSIQLSLEEAKEMQRVQVLDVLGKYPRNN